MSGCWPAPWRALVAFLIVVAPACAAANTLRVAVQKTGTFAWQLDVIARHGLATERGLKLDVQEFASPDAGKLALNGGSVDIAVVDWLWVARERALGRRLKYYPYSTAVGSIMVRAASPLRELADLRGRSLAVAGGALDKSWLIVQAAAKRRGVDLQRDARLMFGAPPLLYEKLRQGEADANLNFWNFCVRLEAEGYRRLYDVVAAERELGLSQPIAMIGYAFPEELVAMHPGLVDLFLAAARKADRVLLESDAEWDKLRPLMGSIDPSTFAGYREKTRAGIPNRPIDSEEADARSLFAALADIGGTELVGPSLKMDPQLYYRPALPET